jgi:methyl-accepting chemotaxis protein
VREAGAAIDQLVRSVQKVAETISEVSAASAQQAKGIDQLKCRWAVLTN